FLFVIFPSAFLVAIGYIIALTSLLFGLYHIVNYFIKGKNTIMENQLVIGLIFFVIGIYIFLVPQFPVSIAPFFFGVYVLINGFMELQFALDLKNLGFEKWFLALILSIIVILLGVFIMMNPFATEVILLSFIGISMIISGISLLVSKFLLNKNKK
ncbi:MAG: hypothetical protein GYA87_01855, partial [Christensenellaceae bacterium]|nr:hypothetical protein [Christensenellaceae bacterium]